MGNSWVIPRKVEKMVWISVSDSYFKAEQGTTDSKKKTMGDSWVIPTTVLPSIVVGITQESPIIFFSQSVVPCPAL